MMADSRPHEEQSFCTGIELPEEPEESLTFEKRSEVYARLKLTEDQIGHLEEMIAASPAREVGAAALKNIRVALASKKNNGTRHVESHTCEQVFGIELERLSRTIGYFTQVPCKSIEWNEPGKKRSVSAATIDFLVFEEAAIYLVECKYLSWLENAVAKGENQWECKNGTWTQRVYAKWSAHHGIGFKVWAQETPMGVYLQNLQANYTLMGEALEPYESRLCKKASKLIKSAPRSIEYLKAAVPGFRERHAVWMTANSMAYGPMKSASPSVNQHYFLFSSARQAMEVDQHNYRRLQAGFDQPVIDNAILSATAIDVKAAEARMDRLKSIRNGDESPTVRMTQLARMVARNLNAEISEFETCLTHYSGCGNHNCRLSEKQTKAIKAVIKDWWNSGKSPNKDDLFFQLEDECKKSGVNPPSRTTLYRHVTAEDPVIRALKRGGMRLYQATVRRSDATMRSQSPLAYGYQLVIDSSDFDTRCAPNLHLAFPAEKAKFYIGVDGATGDSMAHAFIFGSSRTDGLAILLREYVFRHGRLPREIQVDRGPENTSDWLREFCKYHNISLKHPPTGGSKYNGLAENTINHVNSQVAHKLEGSTEPDMAGRKVDGKFKSRKTAKLEFDVIVKEFNDYYYGDMPQIKGADGACPNEKREEALEAYGHAGKSYKYDDACLIETSIKIDFTGKATEKNGVRTGLGYFTSDPLQLALRTQSLTEARPDCVDPSILYAKVGKKWFKAFHKSAQSIALLSRNEKLFEKLYGPCLRKETREVNEDVRRNRHTRQELAKAARSSHTHLAPTTEDSPPPDTEAGDTTDNMPANVIDWNAIEPYGSDDK